MKFFKILFLIIALVLSLAGCKLDNNSQDVCAQMLEAGYAWHYKHYDNNKYYADLEKEARKARRGLWADKKPQAPWTYRKLQKDTYSEKM